MRKLVPVVFLLLVTGVGGSAWAEDIEVLHDPAFQYGFRVNMDFCRRFSQDPQWLQIGECLAYNTSAGYTLTSIPDAPGSPSDAGKYWSFEEGVKQGLICMDPVFNGGLSSNAYPTESKDGELMFRIAPTTEAHRLATNATVQNTPETLRTSVIDAAGQVIRGATTDRKGFLRLDFDSSRDPDNVALNQSGCYRYQTWPTFLLVQHFKELFPLSAKPYFPFKITVQVEQMQKVSEHPTPWDRAELVMYFLLRDSKQLNRVLWVGLTLYSNVNNYADVAGSDQWGLGMVRFDSQRFGGRLAPGHPLHYSFDIKALSAEALGRLPADSPFPREVNDYVIGDFSIGWENLGNYRSDFTVSNLSLKASDTYFRNCGPYQHGEVYSVALPEERRIVSCAVGPGSRVEVLHVQQQAICEDGVPRPLGEPSRQIVRFENDTCDRSVIGWVDGLVKEGPIYSVTGWACAKNTSQSINVALYSSSGQALNEAPLANLPSEPVISGACGTSGINHRFKIKLEPGWISTNQGKKIVVYGISPLNLGNPQLQGSGQIAFPPLTPSIKGMASSALGDFTGDRRADYADFLVPSGYFWIHRNNGSGSTVSFGSRNWGEGHAMGGAAWRPLVADFDGDGRADVADYEVASGYFWVHRNLGNGAFDPANWTWGATQPGANMEALAADLNGDGFADILERNVDTGELTARLNTGYGGGNTFLGRIPIGFVTMTGPEWTVLVADFDGDRKADIADYNRTSGGFWIHRNNSAANLISFDSADWGMAQGHGAPGWKVIVGDFTGDGKADFADLWTATGEFWVHLNYGNGTFQPQGTSTGYAKTYRPNADWKLLGE